LLCVENRFVAYSVIEPYVFAGQASVHKRVVFFDIGVFFPVVAAFLKNWEQYARLFLGLYPFHDYFV
jgi:hypothetical protein